MSEFVKGLNWHENKLNMMAARLTLSNDWEVSIVDWSKTRWPKSGYEIAAINPMGHVAYNFGKLKIGKRVYTSDDVFYAVPAEHVDKLVTWIASQELPCAECGEPIVHMFTDDDIGYCSAYCMEKNEVGRLSKEED